MHTADYSFQLASDMNVTIGTALAVQPDHKQPGFFLKSIQGIRSDYHGAGASPLQRAGGFHASFRFIQHVMTMFKRQLGTLSVKLRQLRQ